MKNLLLALVAAPLAFVGGTALAADPPAKADVCLDCHEAADFKGMSVDDLKASISGILAGQVEHPGVEFSESDVADIAAYFAAEAAK